MFPLRNHMAHSFPSPLPCHSYSGWFVLRGIVKDCVLLSLRPYWTKSIHRYLLSFCELFIVKKKVRIIKNSFYFSEVNLGLLSILLFLSSWQIMFIGQKEWRHPSRKGKQEKEDKCHSCDTRLSAGDMFLIGQRQRKILKTNANLHVPGKSPLEGIPKPGILSSTFMYFHNLRVLENKG